MNLGAFILLLVVVVVPTWFALNCSLFQEPRAPTYIQPERIRPPIRVNPIKKQSKPSEPKKTTVSLNRFKSTPGYNWVRDLDMVVTSDHYVYHRDMPNKEIREGGGTVDLPVRMDRSGVTSGLIFTRTAAEVKCKTNQTDPVLFINIFHSDSMDNLHEGLYAIYMALRGTGLLDKPFRICFVERWGANNQDYINRVFPNAATPALLLSTIESDHPVDHKSVKLPELLDGMCVREVVMIKDQFPIFPPPSARSLVNYRKHLLNAFNHPEPVEHSTKFAGPVLTLPDAAVEDNHGTVPPLTPGKPRVVLVNRPLRDRPERRILNDKAVLEALRDKLQDSADVIYVALERMQPQDIATLMQGTTVLVGTHAPDMINMWYLPRTSSFIAIHPPKAQQLLTRASFDTGAPWLVDYSLLANKLGMNTFVHEVQHEAESLDGCDESRWGLYCAYVKNVEVETEALASLVEHALQVALERKDEKI